MGDEVPTGAMFAMGDGGLGVMPDPADNADQHMVPHHDSGVRVSFEIVNVGDRDSVARVGVEIDDNFVEEWQSEQMSPGETAMGYVSLGRLSAGEHTVLAYVNPGAGRNDHSTNVFSVE
jgi:hypothetical protein